MSYKLGTPVIYRNRNCIISKEGYTARFITSEDYDLINNGLGHLAGTWSTAYDLYDIDNGAEYKKVNRRFLKKLQE